MQIIGGGGPYSYGPAHNIIHITHNVIFASHTMSQSHKIQCHIYSHIMSQLLTHIIYIFFYSCMLRGKFASAAKLSQF